MKLSINVLETLLLLRSVHMLYVFDHSGQYLNPYSITLI